MNQVGVPEWKVTGTCWLAPAATKVADHTAAARLRGAVGLEGTAVSLVNL